MMEQKTLASAQTREFYHDEFVTDQVHDFGALLSGQAPNGTLLDIGGGCGFFAAAVHREFGRPVKVLDADPESVARCGELDVPAVLGDALNPVPEPEVGIVSFNLILHHLVGQDEAATRRLQITALEKWKDRKVLIFVNEYIYQSFIGTVSGALIYRITSSKLLSAIAGMVSKFIPAFRANTFGVGVRFRAHEEWVRLFQEVGFDVVSTKIGQDEPIKAPLRSLLIKAIRRDSFLLKRAA